MSEEGLLHADKALDIYRSGQVSDPLMLSHLYSTKAAIFSHMRRFQEQLKFVHMSHNLTKKVISETDPRMAHSFMAIGNVHWSMDNLDSCQYYYEKSYQDFYKSWKY